MESKSNIDSPQKFSLSCVWYFVFYLKTLSPKESLAILTKELNDKFQLFLRIKAEIIKQLYYFNSNKKIKI